MNISIIGSGYVGLVTGACLADKGHHVVCVDIDPARVAALNSGRPPIHEAGLEALLQANIGQRLHATTNLAAAVIATDLTFITVGTPFNGDGINLDAVLQAARQIGAALRSKPDYHAVIVKSTVVPGTTDGPVRRELEAASGRSAGVGFGLGMNPEFLSEGQAVADFMTPDRLVLGGIDERTLVALEEVYAAFPTTPRVRTNPRTAELIKYTSNALLATLISFSNEIANFASAVGAIDVPRVMDGLHLSQYFAAPGATAPAPITSFLRPGCGFGGSCLPKDVRALIAEGRRVGETLHVLQSVIEVNEQQPGRIIDLLEKRWPDLDGVRVAVLGLAFKPDTNDVRESPAVPIIRELLRRSARVSAHDPVAMPDFRRLLPDQRIQYHDTLEATLVDVDAAVVVTPWAQFRELPTRVRGLRPEPLLVDSRYSFKPENFTHYAAIGSSS